MSPRTVVVTVLTLSVMEVVLSSQAASQRVGGLFQWIGVATEYLISPAYPLIPDLRVPAASRPQLPTEPDQTFAPNSQDQGIPRSVRPSEGT